MTFRVVALISGVYFGDIIYYVPTFHSFVAGQAFRIVSPILEPIQIFPGIDGYGLEVLDPFKSKDFAETYTFQGITSHLCQIVTIQHKIFKIKSHDINLMIFAQFRT